MKVIKHKSGATILDDSYNNNPQAAIETIKTFKFVYVEKRKIVVFGDMVDLGKLENKYHVKLGHLLGTIGIDRLICIGSASKNTAKEASKFMNKMHIQTFKNWKEAVAEVEKYLSPGNAILIKGSRSTELNNIVNKL